MCCACRCEVRVRRVCLVVFCLRVEPDGELQGAEGGEHGDQDRHRE